MATKTLVAGIGCRLGAQAGDIIDLIDRTLAIAGRNRTDLAALATIERKADEPGLRLAAAALGVPLRILDAEELAFLRTASDRVMHHVGVPAVAEAVAATAGAVIVPKQVSGGVTCALALCGPGFDPDHFGRSAYDVNASIAASTLLTSSAGP